MLLMMSIKMLMQYLMNTGSLSYIGQQLFSHLYDVKDFIVSDIYF